MILKMSIVFQFLSNPTFFFVNLWMFTSNLYTILSHSLDLIFFLFIQKKKKKEQLGCSKTFETF